MAPTATTSAAAVLFSALMAMALQLSVAAAAAPIGLPGCNTTCGGVSVPYPFGFGPSRCYWPGLNLTCDTSHRRPRLLLGDGTLRVTEISLENNTVRVMRKGPVIKAAAGAGGSTSDDTWKVPFGHGFTEYGYQLSDRNELVVSGCNVMATLLADSSANNDAPRIVAGCATFCTSIRDDDYDWEENTSDDDSKYCSGTRDSGCCQAPLVQTRPVREVQAKWLYGGNNTAEQNLLPMNVFVAEEGSVGQNWRPILDEFQEVPLVLEWSVRWGLPPLRGYEIPSLDNCHDDIRRKLCRSEHSDCATKPPGYVCVCDVGYNGNPYLPDGCQG